MKKLIAIVAFAFIGYAASAQFHIELGMNFNSPQGDFGDLYDLGVGAYIEPKYALTDNLDLGLMIGTNGFAGTNTDILGVPVSVGATGIVSVLPTATYRFMSGKITPYAGAAMGIYSIAEAEINGTNVGGGANSEFGFAPRAGVYLGRLNAGIQYNIVSDANFLQFLVGIRILSR